MSIIRVTMIAVAALAAFAYPSAPVVLTGEKLPRLLGKPISSIRVLGLDGKAIPFQVDEVTADGEYVLDRGESPNAGDGNGVLDKQDEIVFLRDDAGIWGNAKNGNDSADAGKNAEAGDVVKFSVGGETRAVIIRADPSIPLSPARYVEYDHAAQRVVTPYYYADFAIDRFHFLRAGVMDFNARRYVDLTNELRVEILLRALFGLVPIRYNENSMVCVVRRYKTGPVRLIRRGDFHLNLGLGVKGSKAAVNQICYPRIVEVPVTISLPVNFRAFFSQAYIEMTPVIREAGRDYRLSVRSEGIDWPVGGADGVDSLHPAVPVGKMFSVRRGATGYGWQLSTTMSPDHLGGSGFVMRRPPSGRAGIAECGFRLTVRDVPKGNYYIMNRVLFSGGKEGDIERLGRAAGVPVNVIK